jgi:hypothetical protein
MWVPENAEELEKRVLEGFLEESSILDFKGELPGDSRELAKDVAAMANYGGVLIYGVKEDESKRPTLLNPQRLKGAADRVSVMIRSSLAEPVEVTIQDLWKNDDSGTGYLVIVVPTSPRAPHMVVVKGEHRFYGRTDRANVPLDEGEVSQLYQRRVHWEIDRGNLLDNVITEMGRPQHSRFGYLFLFCRCAASSPSRLQVLGDWNAQATALRLLLDRASRSEVFSRRFRPDFGSGNFRPVSSGWQMDSDSIYDNPVYGLRLQVRIDGETRLFLGRAAEERGGDLLLMEDGIAETVVRFLFFAGSLLQEVRYFGAVDLGIAVTGIKGAIASRSEDRLASLRARYFAHFDQEHYRETTRSSSDKLTSDARCLARELLGRLFHAIDAAEDFDPLSLDE